ncbi:acetylxylan esterase [Catellatospora sp. KI3]|uniref:acetylxylan esterase n=1 Tax=Catellatospora sp. KI3 TaxID=3041620 RepID=UPI00248298B9|nr:acetylxylan esterase [Catellatospora sp. KI3]MDI1463448.1 acetylxylan esterase [Catellatospora sp. KI3]
MAADPPSPPHLGLRDRRAPATEHSKEPSMPHYDLSADELAAYRPQLPRPDDLRQFWEGTFDEAAAWPLHAAFSAVDTGLTVIDTYDTRFTGAGGATIRAWLHLPANRSTAPLPTVVEYVGYGGGRGLPHERHLWAAAGYAHLVVDTRGQGSAWSVGHTPDPAPDGGQPAYPGFATRGIEHRDTYYYRRVYTDAVRAVQAARAHPAVDRQRVAVAGSSQGGGIALAVSALADDIWAVMADVPFLCHFRRGASITDREPYAEIARYLRVHRDREHQVFSTLAYFDAAALVTDSAAPALFSVALMDQVCPPSTVYAAYNHYRGPKQIRAYPFNEHEGGEGHHQIQQLRWLADRAADTPLRQV